MIGKFIKEDKTNLNLITLLSKFIIIHIIKIDIKHKPRF